MIKASDCKQAFAEPGRHNLIDLINPATGRSCIENETLEQIQARYPGAEVVNVDEWLTAKAARQNGPLTWDEIDEEKYMYFLECLPPAAWIGGAFLVGEPYDHDALTGAPRFQACNETGGKWFASSRPMNVKEFREMFKRP